MQCKLYKLVNQMKDNPKANYVWVKLCTIVQKCPNKRIFERYSLCKEIKVHRYPFTVIMTYKLLIFPPYRRIKKDMVVN